MERQLYQEQRKFLHMQTSMKAIQIRHYGDPSVLLLEQVAIPQPQSDEVLLRVRIASINGADLNTRAGRHTAQRHGLKYHPVSRASHLPIIPGMEVCGDVVAVGANVSAEWLGQRVSAITMLGGYAEYATCSVQRIFAVPKNISDEQAATSSIAFLTAYYLLYQRAMLQARETVLLTVASGATGTFMVQLARRIGARVLAVVSHNDKTSRLIELGVPADDIIDRSRETLLEAVQHRIHTAHVDVLLDAVGGAAFADAVATVRPGGRMILYGNLAGMPATFDATLLITAHQNLLGFSLFTYLSQPEENVSARLEILWKAIQQSPPQLHIPVGRIFPLSEAAQAHQNIEERRSTGKTLLRVL